MTERRVAIVTGGTYGIGRATTVRLAADGFAVVACGLDGRQIGSVAERGSDGTRAELAERSLEADLLEADVSRAADVQRLVDFTLAKHGRIDVLINNAAIHPNGTILNTSEDVWDRVIDVNLKGMFLCAKAVIPQMIERGGGVVINVGSGSGWGKPNLLAYSASKGGVHALTTALAYDHLHDRIRVNLVVPGGGVVTGMTEGSPNLDRLAQTTVLGRNTLPVDVADAIAFLASDRAQIISGAVLTVGCFDGQGGPAPTRQ